MAEDGKRRNLKEPPPQTIRGVIIYHEDPAIDDRIRQVAQLREEYGFDIASIAAAIEIGRSQCCAYLRQIQEARALYMAAFPDEFEAGPATLQRRIQERYRLDTTLRNQLAALDKDVNPSNRIGILKLVMRNMREFEELLGLHISRIEHAGEIAVKDSIKAVLDQVPEPIREEYLDALNAVLAAAESAPESHS